MRTGRDAAYPLRKARIRLKADGSVDNGGCDDARIVAALDTSASTVLRARRQVVEEGLDAAPARKRRACSNWLVRSRARAMRAGPCGCWKGMWSNWASSRPQATSRSSACSKNAIKPHLNPAQGQRRRCRGDGGCAGGHRPPPRSGAPAGLPGRVVKFDAIGIMDDAIEDGVNKGGLPNDVVPGRDGELAGDHGRCLTVSLLDDFHQMPVLRSGQRIWSTVMLITTEN